MVHGFVLVVVVVFGRSYIDDDILYWILLRKGFDFSRPSPHSIGIERMTDCLSRSEMPQNLMLVHEQVVFRRDRDRESSCGPASAVGSVVIMYQVMAFPSTTTSSLRCGSDEALR